MSWRGRRRPAWHPATNDIVTPPKLKQIQVGRRLGIHRFEVSALVNDRLDWLSAEPPMRLLTGLNLDAAA
jgi:predicted XRE-type DNA-binding protein